MSIPDMTQYSPGPEISFSVCGAEPSPQGRA
jgi:hypothetical protein